MKWQNLFSGENKENISIIHLLKILSNMLSIYINCIKSIYIIELQVAMVSARFANMTKSCVSL